MSMVVLFGLTSRPGFPCLRAAVAAYLFHCVAISASLLPSLDGIAVSPAVAPLLLEHDLFRKPVATFRDHALEHAEMLGDDGIVELELIGAPLEHDAAGIDDDHVVSKVEREL